MRLELSTLTSNVASEDLSRHTKLVDAAQQFEAMLMQEMLKPMRAGTKGWEDGGKDTDQSEDTLSSYGTEAVAKAIAKSGGLGIARKIVQEVSAEERIKTPKIGSVTKVLKFCADRVM